MEVNDIWCPRQNIVGQGALKVARQEPLPHGSGAALAADPMASTRFGAVADDVHRVIVAAENRDGFANLRLGAR
jgi:hypothetical protein